MSLNASYARELRSDLDFGLTFSALGPNLEAFRCWTSQKSRSGFWNLGLEFRGVKDGGVEFGIVERRWCLLSWVVPVQGGYFLGTGTIRPGFPRS